MAFIDDVIVLMEAAQVGTRNQNIFITSKAAVPVGNGPYAGLTETGGSSPEYIQNQSQPSYTMPSLMLTFRAATSSVARTMAEATWNIFPVWNMTVNGVWYMSIKVMQDIGDRGLDAKNRPMFGFNLIGDRNF